MERLETRLGLARQTLSTLKEALAMPLTDVVRDAAIQRFEYSFEALWKASQAYLREVEGIDVASPKGIIRALTSSKILDSHSATLAMEMADQRNLTVHTYNHMLAQSLYEDLPGYVSFMETWLHSIEEKSNLSS